MTTQKDLPEEATEEPEIRTTEQEADRAARRQEQSEHLYTAKEARHLADPGNPLRIPGELSSKPEEEPSDERPNASERPDQDDSGRGKPDY